MDCYDTKFCNGECDSCQLVEEIRASDTITTQQMIQYLNSIQEQYGEPLKINIEGYEVKDLEDIIKVNDLQGIVNIEALKTPCMVKIAEVQVDTFENVDFNGLKAPIIVIYDHPKDYPDSYVARVWDYDKPTNIVMLSDDLIKLRRMIPRGMVQMKRSFKDDKCIVETWL